MSKADRPISILLDLSSKECQPFKSVADIPSTDYRPPKDIPTMDVYKPPDFSSNYFH